MSHSTLISANSIKRSRNEYSRQRNFPAIVSISYSLAAFAWLIRTICRIRFQSVTRSNSFRRNCGNFVPLVFIRDRLAREGCRAMFSTRCVGEIVRKIDKGPGPIRGFTPAPRPFSLPADKRVTFSMEVYGLRVCFGVLFSQNLFPPALRTILYRNILFVSGTNSAAERPETPVRAVTESGDTRMENFTENRISSFASRCSSRIFVTFATCRYHSRFALREM